MTDAEILSSAVFLADVGQLLRLGHLEPDERTVLEAQCEYLRRTGADVTFGMSLELSRMERRSNFRRSRLLALPSQPENRWSLFAEVAIWYRSQFGAAKALDFLRLLGRRR